MPALQKRAAARAPSGFAYGVEVVRARHRRRDVGHRSLRATPGDPRGSQLASNRSAFLAAGHACRRDVSWHGPCVRGHRPGGYIIDAGPIRLLAPRPRGSSSDPARTDLRVALRVREATRVSGHDGCHGRAGVNRRQLKSPSRLLRARVSGLSSRSHAQIRWAGRETLVAVCKKRIERAMSSLT